MDDATLLKDFRNVLAAIMKRLENLSVAYDTATRDMEANVAANKGAAMAIRKFAEQLKPEFERLWAVTEAHEKTQDAASSPSPDGSAEDDTGDRAG